MPETMSVERRKSVSYTHLDVYKRQGQCWRCKTPIEILVKKQWFVAVNKLIEQTKEAAEEMNWVPAGSYTHLDVYKRQFHISYLCK